MTKTLFSLIAVVTLAFSVSTVAQDGGEAESREEFRSLDQDVQTLKKEVLDLNRDLFLLEEELLFPANSQVAFFISKSGFRLIANKKSAYVAERRRIFTLNSG